MKKYSKYPSFIAFLIVCFWFVNLNSAFAQLDITPRNFETKMRLQGSQLLSYYSINDTLKTKIAIEGPGVLVVNNRVLLDAKTKTSKPYVLAYNINGRLRYTHRIPAKSRSKKLQFVNKGKYTPSQLEKFSINIPPGKYLLYFNTKQNEDQTVLTRFVFSPKQKLIWKEITEDKNLETVTIVHPHLNKKRAYKRITSQQGFSLNTVGYSKIRIYFRAEFDYNTHDQDIIRLTLLKNGSCEANYKATCFRSDEAEYETELHKVPGTLRKYYIDLNVEEAANYELRIKDASKTALVRVFLGKETPLSTLAKL